VSLLCHRHFAQDILIWIQEIEALSPAGWETKNSLFPVRGCGSGRDCCGLALNAVRKLILQREGKMNRETRSIEVFVMAIC
jgi:hypothetical protein